MAGYESQEERHAAPHIMQQVIARPNREGAGLRTATFAMGCFWGPDALYGSLPGVVQTRVGYAGGSTDAPTYRQMGDHSETVQLAFDPELLAYEELLDAFWDNHKPENTNGYKGRQYHSIVFYHDGEQKEAIRLVLERRAEQGKGAPATEIAPFLRFYPAEERHQKYYLKRYPDALDKLNALYGSMAGLTDGTLAARLNGLAKGYTNRQRIEEEIRQWPVATDCQERLLALVRHIRW